MFRLQGSKTLAVDLTGDAVKAKWPLKRVALFFLLAVVPFGGLYGEKLLKKYEADGVIAARARAEGTVNA